MSNHLPDATKMVDRIPCEECGEFHTVEVNVAAFQGVINECSKLQARVKELEELLETQEIDFDWMMMAKRLLTKFRDCETITDIDEEELQTLLDEEGA